MGKCVPKWVLTQKETLKPTVLASLLLVRKMGLEPYRVIYDREKRATVR